MPRTIDFAQLRKDAAGGVATIRNSLWSEEEIDDDEMMDAILLLTEAGLTAFLQLAEDLNAIKTTYQEQTRRERRQ